MSDASAVSAAQYNWAQLAQNNPVELLSSLDSLLDKFGPEELGNAASKEFLGKFIATLRELTNDSDLPEGVKGLANIVLDAHSAGLDSECPCTVEASEAYSRTGESEDVRQSAEAVAEAAKEKANEACCGEGGVEGSSENSSDEATSRSTPSADEVMDEQTRKSGQEKEEGGGSVNWLAVLAGALAEIQAKFLDNAMDAAKTMSGEADAVSESGEGKSTEFLDAQAKYTANMQLFTIFSNQTSTSIKSIGEALAGISRKQ